MARSDIDQTLAGIPIFSECTRKELKAATSLSKVLLAELSPRLVMIPKTAVAALVAELEKAGYTPQQK